MTLLEAYEILETQEKRMHAVGGALSILHWDAAVIISSGSAAIASERYWN